MFVRTTRSATLALAAAAALLAGCSALPGGEEDEARPVTVGTVSAPSVLDPAAAWDQSWELFRNVYQTLMHVPAAGSSPQPDAARRCSFDDGGSTVYRCTLRDGLTFSDGTALDSAAVAHSLRRVMTIGAETGPKPLLASLKEIETPDASTVVFRLSRPDATFPFILATPATALVPPGDYPSGKLRGGNRVTGSGPYTLESYRPGKQAVLARNPEYEGAGEVRNDRVVIRYFAKPEAMVSAMRRDEIDVTFRGLTPEQVRMFQEGSSRFPDVELSESPGTEINYLVFNPEDEWAGNPAVRRAVAHVVDRGALTRTVYDGTTEPLYSMVPAGIAGHTNPFFDAYEGGVEQARAELRSAGIQRTVPLTLGYTTDRYGATTRSEFEELKRQLEASGLFEVTLEGKPWNEFQKAYARGDYPVFGRGWFPDFPDADNYIAPFVGEDNALGTPYPLPAVTDRLLPASREEDDRGVAAEEFEEAQAVLARDARLLPLWQGRVYVAAHTDLAGVENSIDPSTIMLMGELSWKTSW